MEGGRWRVGDLELGVGARGRVVVVVLADLGMASSVHAGRIGERVVQAVIWRKGFRRGRRRLGSGIPVRSVVEACWRLWAGRRGRGGKRREGEGVKRAAAQSAQAGRASGSWVGGVRSSGVSKAAVSSLSCFASPSLAKLGRLTAARWRRTSVESPRSPKRTPWRAQPQCT